MTTKNLDDAAAEIDKIADAMMAAEYLLICGGPTFDDASANPYESEYCTSSLVTTNPNKFMGFWGEYYNEYYDKVPHEGYNILAKFRDKLFSAEDIRKRNKKTKGDVAEEDQFARFMVYTGHIGNSFQKSGIPEQEMMEVNGNLTQWQCGMNPICCARTFGIERGFKFYIDPLTRDALPIKYLPPKQSSPQAKKIRQPFVDSDDEEELFRQNIERDHQLTNIKGSTAEDKARRMLRLRNHARAVRLNPRVQLLDHRFPDLFTGFVEHVGSTALETYTFDGMNGVSKSAAAYAEAQRRNAAAADAPVTDEGADGGGNSKKDKNAPPPPPPKPCQQPTRCSHLLAHVNAVDRGMYADAKGAFTVMEADRYRSDRDAAFMAAGKGPMANESHSVSMRREKVTRYNASMVMVADDASEGSRTTVLPQALRERLLKPYPTSTKGGAVVDEEGQAIDDLAATEMKDWTQSMNGWYYFSNVALARTQQEPIHNSYADFVKIEVPPPSFEGEYQLPTKGTVSFVCETVILAEGEHVPPAAAKQIALANSAALTPSSASAPPPLPPNPYLYTNNVWQIVGHIDTTNIAQSFNDPKGSHARDAFEYILEGRKGHVLHIGSLRSKPQQITYIHVEVPHDDWGVGVMMGVNTTPSTSGGSSSAAAAPSASIASGDPPLHPPQFGGGMATRLVKSMRDNGSSAGTDPASSGGEVLSYFEQQRLAEEANSRRPEELVPTLNHILCVSCREIARPYVLMVRPGATAASATMAAPSTLAVATKDPGFAMPLMNQRNKAFKIWEKSILDALKQDHNKSIVILELGSDRKMDSSRAYAEKTFKLLKTSKCTFVRMCNFNLETKAKSGGSGGDNANQINILCNPIAGLQVLERAVNERIKKITK